MSEEQPHDFLFKEIFSVPEHAASHLRSVLPAALVARIDWDSLALENTRLQVSGLDAKETDVLLSAQLAGKPALLYVVFEHQTIAWVVSAGTSPTKRHSIVSAMLACRQSGSQSGPFGRLSSYSSCCVRSSRVVPSR